MPSVLALLRNDLRTHDQPALFSAAEYAVDKGMSLVALYVVPQDDWQRNAISMVQRDFILRTLPVLKCTLAKLHVPLHVLVVDESTKGFNADNSLVGDDRLGASASVVNSFVQDKGVAAVFFNVEREHDEQVRDRELCRLLEARKVRYFPCTESQSIVTPGQVVNLKSGLPYRVFTPFKKAWIAHMQETKSGQPISAAFPKLPAVDCDVKWPALPDIPLDGDVRKRVQQDWPAGEAEALARLDTFVGKHMREYKGTRDVPCLEHGTSRLSAYLAIGAVSGRTCLSEALKANHGKYDSGSEGAVTWVSELCWRDFYRHIMHHFPHVARGQPFQLKTTQVAWRLYAREQNSSSKRLKLDDDDALKAERELEAWRTGMTGYPLVDAAMRCMQATGWMHNRLRMLTAMFLTKDLLIWWPLGEQHFQASLIDFDFASNNGGWQWSASTGTDSQPYFRIFNPTMQSEKFDPTGAFIRQWCPELRALDDRAIHDPFGRLPRARFDALNYPRPIVDHAHARQRCLQVFMRVFKKS